MILLLPELILTSILSLGFCLSPWTGQFSYEYSFFLSIGIFAIITISALFRFRKIDVKKEMAQTWVFSYLTILIPALVIVLLFSFKYGMCNFSSGLIWFITLPTVTAIYAVACSMWARSYRFGIWRTFLIAISPSIVFSMITVNDLYRDPTLSFYHPVLGYFPGPMYDEWVPKFLSLYTYRIWLVAFSLWLISKSIIPEKKWKIYALVLLPFLFRGSLGWHYSHAWIQKHLFSEVHTRHVKIYFRNQDLASMRRLAKSMDFYIDTIKDKLNIELPKEKFRIYIYSNAAEKKKWSGTGYTLVGNPIQKTLQLLPTDESDTILIHELTHVVASPLGMPILKISPRIGLLEGLATSFQPSQMKLSIHEWAKLMIDLGKLPDLTQVLDPISFWKENPTKVYLATGSFSKWLLDTYDIDDFKRAYHGEDFEKAYGKSLPALIEEWKTFLGKVKSPVGYADQVKYFISQKPFFQKKCVHEIADFETAYEICKKDCLKFINKACALDLKDPDLLLRRARYIFQQDIHAQIDSSMIPLPSHANSRSQNNKIQLFDDDLHHVQDPDHTYKQDDYESPHFDLYNSLFTRMYLSKHAPEVLNGLLLGNYVPEITLTWPKDEFRNHAMFYFAKLALKAKEPASGVYFLEQINVKKLGDREFETAYWTLLSQMYEDANQFDKAIDAYQNILKMSDTEGMKVFSNLQIRRLKYLMLN